MCKFVFGLLIMAICLLFRKPILSFLFGSIEKEVMEAALIYLFVTALSWPFQGIYSASTAIFNAKADRTKIKRKASWLIKLTPLTAASPA